MGTATVGKLLVTAKIQNLEDLFAVKQGRLTPNEVRTVEVPDALVDMGATGFMMPKRLIDELGLRQSGTNWAARPDRKRRYEAVWLEIQGRHCVLEVLEVPDQSSVLIGRIALGSMDWVVDPANQKLIGNPEHGGEEMVEAF